MPGVGSVNDRSLHADELVERRKQVVAVDPASAAATSWSSANSSVVFGRVERFSTPEQLRLPVTWD
jgi:hypothetical protein